MKNIISMLLLIFVLLLAGTAARASEQMPPESSCVLDAGQRQDTDGVCGNPEGVYATALPEGSLLLLLLLQDTRTADQNIPHAKDSSPGSTGKTIVYFFWGRGCPHCEKEMQFLQGLKRSQPSLEVRDFEVWHHRENSALLARLLRAHGVQSSGVPVTFVHDRLFSGFTARTRLQIEKAIESCSIMPCRDPAGMISRTGYAEQTVQALSFTAATALKADAAREETTLSIPFLESLDARNTSLPLITLIIAGMDSFNPCAFFVLLSLLGLLVHARSRGKMLLIGSIFVFFSGAVYFLFMAAWLNLFIVMGHMAAITTIAGTVSLFIAAINIKDFFLFKQGLSLTIPDSAKPRLFERMRSLLRSTSLLSILIGTTVLAVVANSYELLCTAGFPMVFTRILTLSDLSTTAYYLFLVLYNLVYVVPLFLIVLGFTFTLGKRQLTEWQGRVLKLISGSMMLGLGCVLLIDPTLLNSVTASSTILLSALGISLLVAAVMKRVES